MAAGGGGGGSALMRRRYDLVGVDRRVEVALQLMLDGPRHRRHVVAQEQHLLERVGVVHDAERRRHQDEVRTRPPRRRA